MKNQFASLNLSVRILIALFLGFLSGNLLNIFFNKDMLSDYGISDFLDIGSEVFVASLKMLVVPLVFVSLVSGVFSLDSIKKIGKIGLRTLFFYLVTTAIAITIALSIATIFCPGQGFEFTPPDTMNDVKHTNVKEIISNIIPSNPIKAASQGNMLQIIMFALLFGLGIVKSGKNCENLRSWFNEVNETLMNLVVILMHFAPFGVFFLITRVFSTQGYSAIVPLLSYFITVLVALIVQFALTYPILLSIFTNYRPFDFFNKVRPILSFAFSTASSSATIPVSLNTAIGQLGVSRSVASFTVPLGATINMDGTAIMQGVATVFIAQTYRINLDFTNYLTVILTATLASVGTAGVPGVGLVTLAMVLHQVGLPVEGIGLILGVDRVLDMVRTAVNVTGDMAITCIVDDQVKQK